MKLRALTIRLKCDNGVCDNYAEYAVERKGTPTSRELRLCGECIRKLGAIFREAEQRKKGGDDNVGTDLGDCDQLGTVGNVVRGAVRDTDTRQQKPRD